jgi:hypothetical protein
MLRLIVGLLTVGAAAPGIPSAIRFENVINTSGIGFVLDNSESPAKHQPETMIGGVAIIDYNGDGRPDIYFVNGARLPRMDKSDPRYSNQLYRNNGDGTFSDVTAQAGVRGNGYGMGVAAADYDNDGCPDLYIAGVNRNQLFHNNCDGTFTDVTAKAGVAGIHPKLGKTFSIGAGWFDYDNDGLLDLFVVNYVQWDPNEEPECSSGGARAYCSPGAYRGEPNMLFHNNGDGTFTDVSERSGIGKHIGKGMAAVFADYDNDGFTDVFVSNDSYRNFLFHNEGDGTFKEVGVVNAVAYNENGKSIAGMGADFRDVDNDGKPEIFVAAMFGDTFPLFRNRGHGFDDVTSAWGISRAVRSMTAWGAGIYDFDNDGWKDLLASSGSVLDNSEVVDRLPSKLPNVLLRNAGGKHFDDVAAQAGAGFRVPRAHRGAAFADFNNDGRIDAVITCLNERPELLMNRTVIANHWLTLKLRGTKSNRQGLGAKIKVIPSVGPAQYNQATTSVGFASASDDRVHFGLGQAASVNTVEITWPSGIVQSLAGVNVDQIINITEAVSH